LATQERDRISFEILHFLYSKQQETGSLVLGVFFHEIMKLSCSYHMCLNSGQRYEQSSPYPFVNSLYVDNVTRFAGAEAREVKLSSIVKWISKFSRLKPSQCKITFSDANILNVKELVFKFLVKYEINFTPGKSLLYVQSEAKELHLLRETLTHIANIINVKFPVPFIEDFVTYVKSQISESPFKTQSDVLVMGSPMDLRNRILGANYLQIGKPVIAFGHGYYSIYVCDEPIFGYGELSYCSHYVTFGQRHSFAEMGYLKTLTPFPKIYFRGADYISKVKARFPSEIKKNSQQNESKVLYIPTAFSDTKVYGPFRDMESHLYREWQEALATAQSGIYYKAYPGTDKNQIPEKFKEVLLSNLKEIVQDYDLFIIDYFSTVSVIVQATDKPIIYFNLERRNFSPEAKRVIQERVFWVDIDMKRDLNSQLTEALEDFKKSSRGYLDNYTPNYVLNPAVKTEGMALKEILRELNF
jgi:hypothetical protein